MRGDGAAAHLPKTWRKGRCDHLAQRPLVVAGAEFVELELGGRDRRHVIDAPLDIAKLGRGYFGAPRMGNHHPDPARASEGHDDECANRDFLVIGHAEIERFVKRQIEGHARDFHERKRDAETLWINL